MVSSTDREPFWILIVLHIIMCIELIYFRFAKMRKSAKIHNHNSGQDSNYSLSILGTKGNQYLKFPKFSKAVYLKSLKNYHILLKIFFKNYSYKNRALVIAANTVLIIGILGITGSELKTWPNIGFFESAALAALLARLFHSWYSSLQTKQEDIRNEVDSSNSLVRMVEDEVIKRLNSHRITRRSLGYFLMALYYAVNLYYCIRFLIEFSGKTASSWAISFSIAVLIEYVFLESLIMYCKIKAVDYLKIGGNELIEAVCRVLVNQEFIEAFN